LKKNKKRRRLLLNQNMPEAKLLVVDDYDDKKNKIRINTVSTERMFITFTFFVMQSQTTITHSYLKI
jgi:hypothetical protein